MAANPKEPRIAVIGIGPRGLGALEALVERLGDTGPTVRVDIFDPLFLAGAGPNFAPDQSAHCILNIPVREISLGPPSYSSADIGTFSSWLPSGTDPETFPPRAVLGGYFCARFRDLAHHARTVRLSHHAGKVRSLTREANAWWVVSEGERFGPYDEVLLTQGQPATEPDDQLARWMQHARNRDADLVPAYPANRLLAAAQDWAGRTVAIRGLGLSTLDVLRLLTCGLGGRFENGRYHASGHEPKRILPFSLDGQPPAPKPATAAVDGLFDPTAEETRAFEAALSEAVEGSAEAALARICDALRPAATRILSATGSTANGEAVDAWLATERDSPGAQETLEPVEALRAGIGMAHGDEPYAPGYVIGQLWRKWQNELRRGFNSASVAPETARALISFDEGLKRYSYGPPVRSASELLMLIEAGIVDLRAVDDPDIALTATGWQLVADETSTGVSVMVDAVMPPPSLDRSTDPLIRDLLTSGRMTAVTAGFGAKTLADGRLVSREGAVQPGLCLLGRLALGSVIAADSIHDCFGASTDRWADGVIQRLE